MWTQTLVSFHLTPPKALACTRQAVGVWNPLSPAHFGSLLETARSTAGVSGERQLFSSTRITRALWCGRCFSNIRRRDWPAGNLAIWHSGNPAGRGAIRRSGSCELPGAPTRLGTVHSSPTLVSYRDSLVIGSFVIGHYGSRSTLSMRRVVPNLAATTATAFPVIRSRGSSDSGSHTPT